MTALAPLASIADTLVTIGFYVLGIVFVASISIAIACTLAARNIDKARRKESLRPPIAPRERIEVMGGNGISSHERWEKAA